VIVVGVCWCQSVALPSGGITEWWHCQNGGIAKMVALPNGGICQMVALLNIVVLLKWWHC